MKVYSIIVKGKKKTMFHARDILILLSKLRDPLEDNDFAKGYKYAIEDVSIILGRALQGKK